MIQNVISFVHSSLEQIITKDDIVVDATVGNGHDTLFLSIHAKEVIGFDIQKQALEEAEKRLIKHGRNNVSLVLKGHEHMDVYVQDKVKAVTFNLGYLPGSDKTITTLGDTTLMAIEKASKLLQKGGLISITAYVGHNGGNDEAKRVEDYLKTFDKDEFQVLKYSFINKTNAPFVLLIEKTK